jgi:hypothetical protein
MGQDQNIKRAAGELHHLQDLITRSSSKQSHMIYRQNAKHRQEQSKSHDGTKHNRGRGSDVEASPPYTPQHLTRQEMLRGEMVGLCVGKQDETMGKGGVEAHRFLHV